MNKRSILQKFEDSADLKIAFVDKYLEDILGFGKRCVNALKNDKKIMFCGNGGSASDGQHLAAELVGKYKKDRPPLRALALTTNTSSLTAIANDYDFKYVFKRQVEAWGNKGDILIAISTSGNSENVVQAVKQARKMKIYTAGFLGNDGGRLGKLVDFAFIVPSSDTARIQETHITLGHVICHLIESTLFG